MRKQELNGRPCLQRRGRNGAIRYSSFRPVLRVPPVEALAAEIRIAPRNGEPQPDKETLGNGRRSAVADEWQGQAFGWGEREIDEDIDERLPTEQRNEPGCGEEDEQIVLINQPYEHTQDNSKIEQRDHAAHKQP